MSNPTSEQLEVLNETLRENAEWLLLLSRIAELSNISIVEALIKSNLMQPLALEILKRVYCEDRCGQIAVVRKVGERLQALRESGFRFSRLDFEYYGSSPLTWPLDVFDSLLYLVNRSVEFSLSPEQFLILSTMQSVTVRAGDLGEVEYPLQPLFVIKKVVTSDERTVVFWQKLAEVVEVDPTLDGKIVVVWESEGREHSSVIPAIFLFYLSSDDLEFTVNRQGNYIRSVAVSSEELFC